MLISRHIFGAILVQRVQTIGHFACDNQGGRLVSVALEIILKFYQRGLLVSFSNFHALMSYIFVTIFGQSYDISLKI